MSDWTNSQHEDCAAEGSPKLTRHGVFQEREEWDETVVCTLPKGHSGPHVAEDIYGNVVGSWPA